MAGNFPEALDLQASESEKFLARQETLLLWMTRRHFFRALVLIWDCYLLKCVLTLQTVVFSSFHYYYYYFIKFLQCHNNAANANQVALPDRPSTTSQNTLAPDEVEEWWQALSDPTPVPPLFLQSPTESSREHNWLTGAHNTSNQADKNLLQDDVDNLQTVTNNLDHNITDFDMVEGNSRIKPNRSISKRDDIPKLFLDDLNEDESESKRRKAAVNIQRWYRGWKIRKELHGQNAIKQLLSQKKSEKETQLFSAKTEVLNKL